MTILLPGTAKPLLCKATGVRAEITRIVVQNFFRDGLYTATIYPQGFKFPKLKRGKPVTIYTQVISGEENVVFSALGLKME
ncbi:MAG: hypothetical protein R2874_07815 [Desulfobacterales bacterium]